MNKILKLIIVLTIILINTGCDIKSDSTKEIDFCDSADIKEDTKPLFNDIIIKDREDINRLKEYTSIRGSLSIQDTSIDNIIGLENIVCINDDLFIKDNSNLLNLNGLNKLKTIGNELTILDNDKLEDLTGLDALAEALSIIIRGNDNLRNINGLREIDVGSLIIKDNQKLLNIDALKETNKNIGWDNPEECWENEGRSVIEISNNNILENIDGFINIQEIHADLIIADNESLKDINGLKNIHKVEGNLTIYGNDLLEDLQGLSGLKIVMGTMSIGSEDPYTLGDGNESLKSLNGLNNLEEIGDSLNIDDNNSLETIDDLDKLSKIGQMCHENIISTLYIIENDMLPKCEIDQFVERILNDGYKGSVFIEDNYDGGTCE